MKPATLAGLGLVIVGAALVLAQRVGVPPSIAPRPSAQDVFTDTVTHFSLAKPAGWWMTAGPTLRQQAEAEARQRGDTRLAPSGGEPIELLVRFTRYGPGEAPGPNPTIVVTRFDLRRFPTGTRPGVRRAYAPRRYREFAERACCRFELKGEAANPRELCAWRPRRSGASV